MAEEHCEMNTANSTLVVERVDVLPSRPQWIFVTGVLSGEPIRVGDTVYIRNDNQKPVATTIKSIEIHSPPGKTTVMLDVESRPIVTAGTVVSR